MGQQLQSWTRAAGFASRVGCAFVAVGLGLSATALAERVPATARQANPHEGHQGAAEASPDANAETVPDAPSPSRAGILLQGRLDFEFPDRNTDTSVQLRPALQRVRPSLRLATDGDEFVSFVQLHTVPEALYLVDLWAELEVAPELRLRAGQFKVPFTRYRSNSVGQLSLVDWPITAFAFGAEWQLGTMLHSVVGAEQPNPQSFDYAIGVFMGAPRTSAFATGVAATYGDRLPNDADLTDPELDTRVHPELVARIGQGVAGADGEGNSDPKAGAPRHHISLSLAWDTAPDAGRDFAVRCSPEVLLKAYGLTANLVGYLGFIRDRDVVVPAMMGGHLEAAWRRGPYEVVGRHARLHYLGPLMQAAVRAGEARLESSDADQALQNHLATLEHLEADSETLLGFNYYATSLVKLQADAGVVGRHGANLDNEWLARTQLQLMY